ncbi:DUF421 domain-containing protein [Metabacillus herbersteinensis]|uniref:DUF421 domain-containing protein n=1 Tax=Metabacillus herbersteinensis TaxID=283816 RepID=A0ABV6GDY8_9BACI
MDYAQMVLELIIGFIGLFIVAKILGKTQITQITTFDFISALVLGEFVGNAVFDDEVGISRILFAITIWGALIYLLETITQKWNLSRGFLEGRPSIIIHHGKISKEQLKKNKLDINQLQHLVRSKGVFSLREVEYAVLETDGTISVLRKSTYDVPTNQDLNLQPTEVHIPITFISDGVVISANLKQAGFDDGWLRKELHKKNIDRIEDVLYAEWLEGQGLHVQAQ